MESRSHIHFDAPFVTVHWDDEAKAVHVEWKEELDGATLRRGFDVATTLLEQRKSRKWLGDLRRMGGISPEDTKWANEVWMPRALAAGMRWLAVVQARRVVVQMALKMFMSRIGDVELTTAHFHDLEEARRWLRDQG
jgi:hypothetical protein